MSFVEKWELYRAYKCVTHNEILIVFKNKYENPFNLSINCSMTAFINALKKCRIYNETAILPGCTIRNFEGDVQIIDRNNAMIYIHCDRVYGRLITHFN